MVFYGFGFVLNLLVSLGFFKNKSTTQTTFSTQAILLLFFLPEPKTNPPTNIFFNTECNMHNITRSHHFFFLVPLHSLVPFLLACFNNLTVYTLAPWGLGVKSSWQAEVTMAMRAMNSLKSISRSPFWSRSAKSSSRVSFSWIFWLKSREFSTHICFYNMKTFVHWFVCLSYWLMLNTCCFTPA